MGWMGKGKIENSLKHNKEDVLEDRFGALYGNRMGGGAECYWPDNPRLSELVK